MQQLQQVVIAEGGQVYKRQNVIESEAPRAARAVGAAEPAGTAGPGKEAEQPSLRPAPATAFSLKASNTAAGIPIDASQSCTCCTLQLLVIVRPEK